MRTVITLLLAATPALTALTADWPEYQAPDKQFTAAFPGNVTVKQAQNRYPFGLVTITAHTHTADKDTVWRIATHDYPAAFVKQITPAKLMDVMARGMTKNVKGKITGPQPVKHAGYAGIEFQVTATAPNSHAIHARLFTIDARVYQLTLVAKPNAPAHKEVKKFFDSFKPTN